VVLNLSAALAVGAATSMAWLSRDPSNWAARQQGKLRRVGMGALAVAVLACLFVFCLEAANMAEVPLLEAGPAIIDMATSTHFGTACCVGFGALLVAFGVFWLARPRLVLLALAVFFYTRSMVSHAAGDGDLSLPMAADWLHLIVISLWVGEVIVAGLITLPKPVMLAGDRAAMSKYVEALSTSATVALTGIVATGLYGAYRNIGTIENLTGTAYGLALLMKLAAVFVAASLGGANRFLVMPGLLRALHGRGAASDASARRFTLILQVEAVVLLLVLVLAAVLSSTSPPMAA
jgi:putative copper resistance protein D